MALLLQILLLLQLVLLLQLPPRCQNQASHSPMPGQNPTLLLLQLPSNGQLWSAPCCPRQVLYASVTCWQQLGITSELLDKNVSETSHAWVLPAHHSIGGPVGVSLALEELVESRANTCSWPLKLRHGCCGTYELAVPAGATAKLCSCQVGLLPTARAAAGCAMGALTNVKVYGWC